MMTLALGVRGSGCVSGLRKRSSEGVGRVVDELDIWRSAKLLLDNHGAKADQVAHAKLDAMRIKGDTVGVAVWQRILAAISKLRRERPIGDESVH